MKKYKFPSGISKNDQLPIHIYRINPHTNTIHNIVNVS